VIPARLFGAKESGGKVELFLVRRLSAEAGEVWSCLIRASKPPKPDTCLIFPEGLTARVVGRDSGETWRVDFAPAEEFEELLEKVGRMPLPPYIKREAGREDADRYQTVFARNKGAVAAPTAGLHFTEQLLEQLRGQGVTIAPVTLHVGLGTFMPIRVENINDHRMHREFYHVPASTVEAIHACKKRGGRVIALGTTTARALEHAAAADGKIRVGEGEADIFITPGYRFRVIDGLITNFHLPKSTLIMLVSAFAGKDLLFRAYAEAVAGRFRFFSYGDAMFIY